ncbi:uro-adherence factor UafA, partial [Staphylococcus saprophyticus]|nr:uro-adherence factor UafA [Staphylococcus saprophyticus]
MNKNKKRHRFDFLPNRLNKYSIRKFTNGIASVLIGSTILLGAVIDKEADAAEQQPTSEVYGQTDNNYKSESNKSNSVQHDEERTNIINDNDEANYSNHSEIPIHDKSSEYDQKPINEQDTSNHHETHLNQNATENHVKEESKEVSTEEESIEDRKTEESTTEESKAVEEANKENTTEKNDEGSLDLEKEKDTYKDEKDNGKKKNELESHNHRIENKVEDNVYKNNKETNLESKNENVNKDDKVNTSSSTSIEKPEDNATRSNLINSVNHSLKQLDNAKNNTEKQSLLENYYQTHTNATASDAKKAIEKLNIDFTKQNSDQLIALLLIELANQMDKDKVQANVPASKRAETNNESLSIETNTTNIEKTLAKPSTSKFRSANTRATNVVNYAANQSGRNVNHLVFANTSYEILGGGKKYNQVFMTMDGKLKIKIDYTVDDSVVEGDYFTVDFGKYIHPGTSRKPYRVNNIHDANGRTIAIGSYDSATNTAKYTFTNYVDIYNNVRGSFSLLSWPFKELVTTDKQSVPVGITVAGEDYTQNVIFNYGNRTVPVISDINYLTKDFAEFTTYINQNRAFNTGSKVRLSGQGFKFTSPDEIEVYKVLNNSQFRDSFSPDYANLTQVRNPKIIINSDGSATVDLGDIGTLGYIIRSKPNTLPDFSGIGVLKSEYTFTNNKNQRDTRAHASSIQFVRAELAGFGGFGGYVWFDKNNDGVQNDSNATAAGITVNLLDPTGIRLATTTTDITGHYNFDNLTNGNYLVEFVMPEGYIPTQANNTVDDKDSDVVFENGRYIAHVTIKDADNMTIDAGLVSDTTSESLSLSESLSTSQSLSLSHSLSLSE